MSKSPKGGIGLDSSDRYVCSDAYRIRNEDRPYTDPGSRADKEKKALFGAATKVTDLTTNIGTEIEGLQLKDLTDQQKDELALLIAERSVVFFRDQDLSPQNQKALGEWFGEVEIHVSVGPARYHIGHRQANMMCSLKSLKFQACQASA